MMKWEEKLRAWLMEHVLWFGAAAVLLLGLFLRYTYLPLLAADLEFMNASWFDAIKAGGMAAVLEPSLQYTYSPLHLYLWTLATLLPWDTYTVLKLVSIAMEMLLCAACVVLLRTLLPKQNKKLGSFVGFTLLWLNPVLLWNAAGWGQTDASFALFCVLALWLLLKEKPAWALAALGVALAWKLQAIFLLPLFMMAYFCGKKRFSALWFLLVPGILVLSGVPMMLIGESPLFAVQVYLGQTDLYSQITYNYPNIYALMGEAIGNKTMILGMFSRTGMALCIAALGGMAVWLITKKVTLQSRATVLLGAWCVLCCVFFLPRMHERYGIVGELLLLCWAVCLWKPRGFVYVLLGMLPVLSAYAEYMFRHPFFPLQWGAVLNLILLGLLTWEVLREVRVEALEAQAL
ncbi:MAG: glycosyltransferase 87 family protein [Clostridia bacterium]